MNPFNESFSPRLREHTNQTPPSKVYHYTSAEALIGIVNHKEMWCTDASFLNDSRERFHAFALWNALIQERIKTGKDSPQGLDYLGALTLSREYERSLVNEPVYIASFTELEDALSQWRAYCPPSGGYAIGFPSAHILELAKQEGVLFAKCIYDLGEQRLILSEVLEYAIHEFEEKFPGQLFTTTKNDYASIQDNVQFKMVRTRLAVHHFVKGIAPLMKDDGFAEEKEWRLIVKTPYCSPSCFNTDITSVTNTEFRHGVKGLIPYCKFKLVNETATNFLVYNSTSVSIMIGPCADRENREYALNQFMQRHTNFSIGFSKTPYRT